MLRASPAKKLLRVLRHVRASGGAAGEVDDLGIVLLVLLTGRARAGPAEVASEFRLSRRRTRAAWAMLQERGLLGRAEGETDASYTATDAGRQIAADAVAAAQIAGFEPEGLQRAREHERKAPFDNPDRAGWL